MNGGQNISCISSTDRVSFPHGQSGVSLTLTDEQNISHTPDTDRVSLQCGSCGGSKGETYEKTACHSSNIHIVYAPGGPGSVWQDSVSE